MSRNLIILLSMLVAGSASGQISRLPTPDTLGGNFFGASVAIDQGLAVVGATGAAACGENSGAAYVYAHDRSGNWRLVQTLSPADCGENQFFGKEVAISGDRIAVSTHIPFFGAAQSNAVFIFEPGPEGWHQTARLNSPVGARFGAFGSSVSLDGSRLLITSSGDVSTARTHGIAFVYDQDDQGNWTESARLHSSQPVTAGIFGTSGSLDGDRVAVSASTWARGEAGFVSIFDRDATGTWTESAMLHGIRDFFISLDLDQDLLIVGEGQGGRDRAGRARIFERAPDGSWGSSQTLLPETPYPDGGFGSEVAIRGDRALVVGFDEQLALEVNIDRVVYVYHRDPDSGRWTRRRIVDVGQNSFGASVDVSGTTAIIGQTSDLGPGMAYVVEIR